jgi:hypothetical protein
VKLVVAIDSIEPAGENRRAIVGHLLPDDHPLTQRWLGAAAPDSFRQPVTYIHDENDPPSTCGCGCGETVPEQRSFMPGHDQKAIHDRIARQWGGTVGFVNWFDATYPDKASELR